MNHVRWVTTWSKSPTALWWKNIPIGTKWGGGTLMETCYDLFHEFGYKVINNMFIKTHLITWRWYLFHSMSKTWGMFHCPFLVSVNQISTGGTKRAISDLCPFRIAENDAQQWICFFPHHQLNWNMNVALLKQQGENNSTKNHVEIMVIKQYNVHCNGHSSQECGYYPA